MDAESDFEAGGDVSLVTISSYFSVNDAYMARLKLQAEGIDVFLDNENIVAISHVYGRSTGGIELRVPAGQAELAAKILMQKTLPTCPECNSQNIIRKPLPKWMLVLSIIALSIPLWLTTRPWQCESCGHTWK